MLFGPLSGETQGFLENLNFSLFQYYTVKILENLMRGCKSGKLARLRLLFLKH